MKRRRFFLFLALFLAGLFCLGLVRLLVLRYAAGDVYPPYSSLRADPLGARIFYESLRSLPAHEVVRNERDLDRLGDGARTALYIIGARGAWVSEKEIAALEHFVQSGGRLIVSFFPQYSPATKSSPSPIPSPSASPSASPEPTPRGRELEKLLLKWDVKLKHDSDRQDDVARRAASVPLEGALTWHSGISFQAQHPDWRVIYKCKRGPVVVERSFGRGTVVLSADSYFFSNEALLEDRAPEFLAWLSDDRPRAIFDETHLDIHENPGVMTLLRRYGLGGFVLGFFGLIALWLWRNATWSLAPRRATKADDAVRGRESFGGFVNLLRRGIAPAQLLEVSLREWQRSHSATGPAKAAELAAIAAENFNDPVAGYNRLSEMLHTRPWKPTN